MQIFSTECYQVLDSILFFLGVLLFIDFFSNVYSLSSMKIIFVTGGIISGL